MAMGWAWRGAKHGGGSACGPPSAAIRIYERGRLECHSSETHSSPKPAIRIYESPKPAIRIYESPKPAKQG